MMDVKQAVRTATAWHRRSFKVIQVQDDTGDVRSMTHRVLPGIA